MSTHKDIANLTEQEKIKKLAEAKERVEQQDEKVKTEDVTKTKGTIF